MAAKILVVEDEPDVLNLLRLLLQRAGFEVISAENGGQALFLMGQETPDLVLCDVLMPNLNGYETLAAIRGDPRTRHLPVLMISARGRARDIQFALEAGADGYIVKPFQSRELVAEILRHVQLGSVAQ